MILLKNLVFKKCCLFSVFLFITYFTQCVSHPFILKKPLSYCYYEKNNSNKTLSFSSEILQAETEKIVIYYTLCGYLPLNQNCGKNAVACLKNKKDNSTTTLGRKFNLGTNKNVHFEVVNSNLCMTNSSRKYNLTIKFVKDGEGQHLEAKDECDYVITAVPDFQPTCTTKIYGQLMDLRPLRDLNKIFQINSEGRNFSITLCSSNKNCKGDIFEDISACEILNNNTIIPLSRVNSEGVFFNNDKNEISIHGSYKGDRKQDNKKFEIALKCNWNEESGKIHYKKPSQQGKFYRFDMETIYGCVKLPPECEKTDGFFIYNLTALSNPDGFTRVSNVSDNTEIYLNICGSLKLNRPKNNCTDGFSQVCEISNGIFTNRGSISSPLKLRDDIITLTFTDGAKCTEDITYSTDISFICSATERGPMFVGSDKCKTYINWYSPQVCPKYNTANCEYIQQKYHNCVIDYMDYRYDLSSLTLKDAYYEVQDNENSSIKYALNVCGPAIDSEASCMKDSMVLMKDLNQFNLKYKVKSLGKMLDMYVDGKNVVIKTQGSYCGPEGDYISVITFICSGKEEKPRLVHKTQCTFHFQWKTRQACPIGGNEVCMFGDSTNNSLFNLNKSKRTLVNISHNNGKMYKFDLCKNNYTECISGTCNYHQLHKELVVRNKKSYLDLHLEKECSNESEFNKVSFELVCENMLNNEHYVTVGVSNCSILMKFFSNFVCNEDPSLEYTKYEIDKQEEVENCSVTNSVTGYRFYISSLQIAIPFPSCPKTIFNPQDSSVLLLYSNKTVCNELNGYGRYVIKIHLQCSTIVDKSNQETTSCSTIYKFTNPEFCKLFETNTLQNISKRAHTFTPGIIIGIVIGGLALFGFCFFIVFKLRKRILGASSYDSVYQKDADL